MNNTKEHKQFNTVLKELYRYFYHHQYDERFQHQVHSLEINKVGLCCYDNKRYLLDKVNSLSYGHYKIGELKS